MTVPIALLFVLPITALAAQLNWSGKNRLARIKITQVTFSMLLLLLSFYLFFLDGSLTIIHVADWPAPYGIVLVFDSLTKLMMVVFSIVITCINLFSLTDSSLKNLHHFFYMGSWLLILGVIGALTTYDIFNLYVWSEVILISAFIILSASHAQNNKKIWNYAIFNIIGTLLILLAIALLYGLTGHLNAAAISQYLATTHSNFATLAIALMLLGFAVKGGIFPFYFWLPDNYPATSNTSTLLLSSLVTKVIMLVILKLVWLWQPLCDHSLTMVFILLACCTMFFGVMGAANEFRLRHILSFHIISQLGYILLVIFIPTKLAIIAMLYFLIHNIFVKTNLIMTASIIESEYKTNKLSELGGLLTTCPLLAVIFFVSAMSLAGFPPLSGFWGKLLIFKSAFDQQLYIPLFFAILVSLFTLYSMIKIWRYVYCETAEKSTHSHSFKLDLVQRVALLSLLLLPLFMGVFPNSIFSSLQNIADQISQPQIILDAILGDIK